MKIIKIGVIVLCVIAAVGGIIFGIVGFRQNETASYEQNEDEIYKLKIVALERNAFILYKSAMNMEDASADAYDLYSMIEAGNADSGAKLNYQVSRSNMEGALEEVEYLLKKLDEETEILFPEGFNEENEAEKTLGEFIASVRAYVDIAKEKQECCAGFIEGRYTKQYAAERWNELNGEAYNVNIFTYEQAYDIIADMK